MTVVTILSYMGIIVLIFGCLSIVYSLIGTQITGIDIRNLTVEQLPSKKNQNTKISIYSFLEYGPSKNREYVFKNGSAIVFYISKFRLIEATVQVLYIAPVILGAIIFIRISSYGLDVTTIDTIRSIVDYIIAGYFIVWLFFVYKMRTVAISAKRNYERFIS